MYFVQNGERVVSSVRHTSARHSQFSGKRGAEFVSLYKASCVQLAITAADDVYGDAKVVC